MASDDSLYACAAARLVDLSQAAPTLIPKLDTLTSQLVEVRITLYVKTIVSHVPRGCGRGVGRKKCCMNSTMRMADKRRSSATAAHA
jgi:hypothetical protein